jgi:O-antigen/teichoic acid export membrane protein
MNQAPSAGTPRANPPRGPFALILRNVTSSWAALLVNTIISFVLAPIVVTHLGSVYYGVWSLLMQFTGYLWLFDFGVRESVIKYVAQYQSSGETDKLETTVRTAISVYALVALVALAAVAGMVAVLPFLFNIPPEAILPARIAAFVTGATVAQSFLTNVFVGMLMGLQRIYLVSQVGVLFALVRAAGTYLLLINGYGIVGLSLLHLAMSLVNGALVIYLCRVHLPQVPLRPVKPAREEVQKLFNYGKYVLLANIGDKVVFATDAIVIGIFLPIASLTPYAIAGTLISHMRSVVMAMASIFNPLTSHLRAGGDETALQWSLACRCASDSSCSASDSSCCGWDLSTRVWPLA